MANIPKRPTGSDAEAHFMQWVWDSVQALRVNESASIRVSRSSRGVTLSVSPGAVTGGADPAQYFHFARAYSNYILTQEGIAVARTPTTCCDLSGDNIYGAAVVYTYPHNVGGDGLAYLYRVAKATVNGVVTTENEGITPPYIVGRLITAVSAVTPVMTDPTDLVSSPGGVSQPVVWIESGPRAWGAFADQTFGT